MTSNEIISDAMRQRFQSLRVLVIDDNKFSRSLVTTQLASYGIRGVAECGDGVEGLKLLQQVPYDIVLLDYEMMPLNGAEFARLVRRDPSISSPEVPIIMISGYSDVAHVREARDAGINEFLTKPVAAKTLYKRIEYTLLHPRPFVRTEKYIGPMPREGREPSSATPGGGAKASGSGGR
ncbi:response regulator [Roseospira visakhapatnamensis]|uniref:CheY-like chemotaxis protein n=1 Tax=Roseospira visakhapatnamensis TaxID=390880 RepID=A0A7W6W9V0_9PROT|nr:response regulator [Roseospira visakhapatnamensis]MBB4265802.1 CheY-like chemotaxis protein [Roseospira visakhapatnamensis]